MATTAIAFSLRVWLSVALFLSLPLINGLQLRDMELHDIIRGFLSVLCLWAFAHASLLLGLPHV